LDGIVDIYMPDFKYWDPDISERLSGAREYPEVVREAVREMHRQTGDLVLDENGLARRGLLIRHLVLPNLMAGTREVMRFLAEDISANTYVNIMGQYRPHGNAPTVSEIRRPVTEEETTQARRIAVEAGLHRFER
jgi:putative pyruvate formate lyase activating enzyme